MYTILEQRTGGKRAMTYLGKVNGMYPLWPHGHRRMYTLAFSVFEYSSQNFTFVFLGGAQLRSHKRHKKTVMHRL